MTILQILNLFTVSKYRPFDAQKDLSLFINYLHTALRKRNVRVQLNLMAMTQITLAWKQSIPVCFILQSFRFYIHNGLSTINNNSNLRQ